MEQTMDRSQSKRPVLKMKSSASSITSHKLPVPSKPSPSMSSSPNVTVRKHRLKPSIKSPDFANDSTTSPADSLVEGSLRLPYAAKSPSPSLLMSPMRSPSPRYVQPIISPKLKVPARNNDEGRNQRKLLDLEISNKSLLLINRHLERRNRDQSRQISSLFSILNNPKFDREDNDNDVPSDCHDSDGEETVVDVETDVLETVGKRVKSHTEYLKDIRETDLTIQKCLALTSQLIESTNMSLAKSVDDIKVAPRVADYVHDDDF